MEGGGGQEIGAGTQRCGGNLSGSFSRDRERNSIGILAVDLVASSVIKLREVVEFLITNKVGEGVRSWEFGVRSKSRNLGEIRRKVGKDRGDGVVVRNDGE